MKNVLNEEVYKKLFESFLYWKKQAYSQCTSMRHITHGMLHKKIIIVYNLPI